MAVTFTTAPEVTPGEGYNSKQFNGLADAYNDRLKSGLGDVTYRIHQYFFNLWRLVRNPSTTLAYPAQSEFFQFYMHLRPDEGTWPGADPGQPEGANLANHMMGFVYGRDVNLLAEVTRLQNVVMWANGNADPPLTDVQKWQVAKLQRGVYDPVSDTQNVPALETAQSYFRVEPQFMGSHGRSYGSFPPVPEVLGTCANGSAQREYRFTHIPGTLPDKVYSGGCEENTTDVRTINRTSVAYYVWFFDDTYERLEYSEWLEGPYSLAGDIEKPDANSLPRMLNAFAHDFRGTDSERQGEAFDIMELGFDFEKFYTRQYYLAPNIAHQSGPDLIADYPFFRFRDATTHPAGTLAIHEQSSTTEHAYTNGFVFAGFYVEQFELTNEVVIEALSDTTVIGEITVSVGAIPAIQMIELPTTPTPLKFRLKTEANFTSTAGFIAFECLELLAYMPNISDAYLMLRLMATDGNELEPVDGSGLDEQTPKNFSDAYFEKGLILNTTSPVAVPQSVGLNGVNNNPIFDGARRLCRDNMRELNRFDLLDYEVAGGKSILRFKRFTKALAGLDLDSFDAFAPDATTYATGELVTGETYIVRSGGPITHNGTQYNAGETFTAVNSDYTGTADVRVYEGIKTVALPNGKTNEWLFDIDTLPYHESGTSIYDPEGYSDYFFHINRCHFDTASNELGLTTNRDLYLHFEGDISAANNLAPNSPSGYNFINNINADFSQVTGGMVPHADRDQFFTSCQIYKTPHEVESIISYEDGGIEVVEITLKDRLLHNPSAAASYPRDHTLWDATAIANETYRTEENAILEYVLDQKAATRCSVKYGDMAATANAWSEPDNPRGSCYPKLKFTRLIPRVYEDNNDTTESTDTLLTARDFLQLETYLRAMSEGFIDGLSTANNGCSQLNKPGMFDYTFENLCYDAFGNRWLNQIPTSIRTDNPEGFGPKPNVVTYAELFNQFAKCINKLDKVRIPLPLLMECKHDEFDDVSPLTPTWDPDGCGTSGTHKAVALNQASISPGTQTVVGSWGPCSLVSPNTNTGISATCNGANWQQSDHREQTEFRLVLEDPLAINAIPLLWRDMINTGNTGLLCERTETIISPVATEVSTQPEADGCGPNIDDGFFWDPVEGKGWTFADNVQETISCVLVNQGVIAPPMPPTSDFYRGVAGVEVCSNSSQHRITLDPVLNQVATYLQIPLV